jgi:hypothetical protein
MTRHVLGKALPWLALSLAPATAQQTLLVGPGQTFTAIQPAIAAAAPGDTVLVLAGTYSGPLDIDKGIQLIGQGADISGPTGLFSPGFATVHDLPANQRFTMAGFRAVQGSSQPTGLEGIGIVVQNCAGFVALRDLSSSGGFRRFTVSATGSPQVFVGSMDGYGIRATNSTVVCEACFLESAAIALYGVDSSVVVVGCTIQNTGSPFSFPVIVEGGRLVASRSTIASGSSSFPKSAITATNTELLLDPSTVLQPNGGAPAIQGGTAVSFPFASMRAQLTAGALTVLSHGTANETFATVFAPVVGLQSTPFGLTWLDAPQTSLLGFASYGANRLHSVTLPLPPLPPGLVVGLQTIGFEGGTIGLGVPSVVVTQ